MKFLRMKIHRSSTGGGTHYEYPESYNPQKVVWGPIYESIEKLQEVKARNHGEYIIFGVNDNDVDIFLKDHGKKCKLQDDFKFNCEEVTKEKILEDHNDWIKPREKMLDKDLVISTLVKAVKGKKLEKEDEDILDPENRQAGGIVRTKNMAEILAEL